MFLPLARKRENVLEGARLLGYEPTKSSGYRYRLTLTLNVFILPTDVITIEKYTKFISGSKTYYYMGDQTIELYGSIGQQFFFDVQEGVLKSFVDEPALIQYIGTEIDPVTNFLAPTSYVDIPFTNVDENGIELFLSYIDGFGNQVIDEKWTKSDIFMVDADTNLKKEFLRIDDIDYGTPRLYFKYAGIGNTVVAGSIIKAIILISSGTLGASTTAFTFSDPSLTSIASITNATIVAQGAAPESIASVQRNAPLFFNTANRVITTSDYESFCNRDSRVKNSKVWGGEDEYPQRPGEIWFSFIPETFTRSFTSDVGNINYTLDNQLDTVNLFLEESEIRTADVNNPGIWDILDLYRIPTLKLHNRHPIILNCEFDIQILKYNITQSRAVEHSDIFNIIDNYFKENIQVDSNGQDIEYIEKFDIEYFNSSVVKRIDSYLSDTSGFNISMTNNIDIFDKNISKENYLEQVLNLANIDIFIQLAFPFESIFTPSNIVNSVETGYTLIPSVLPDISGTIFKSNGVLAPLTIDWSGITGNQYVNHLIEADIKHGTNVIGKYSIHNDSIKYITINFFGQDDTSASIDPVTNTQILPTDKYLTSTLKRSDFAVSQLLNIKFFSPNFKTTKNTLTRLKRVTFN
jgi:hypothetical protein